MPLQPLAPTAPLAASNSEHTRRLVALAWGAVVALAVCRHFFLLPAGEFFDNHEGESFPMRSVEFRDCLRNGVLSPQWCVDFRAGLGSPYFSYYQPGYFYAESLLPAQIPPVRRMGLVALACSWLGFWGAFDLVARRHGAWSGALAGTLLLAARYGATNLYLRNAMAEYCAAMLFVVALAALDRWSARPTRRAFLGAALACGALVTFHPAVSLAGYAGMVAWIGVRALATRTWRPAAGGLAVLASGAGLSAFYWLPVAAEWSYVESTKAFAEHYHYSRHFLTLTDLLGPRVTSTPIPVKLGWFSPLLAIFALVVQWRRRSAWDVESVALAIGSALLLIAALAMIHPWSRPIWDQLQVLQRLQFPWRLLSFAGLGLALVGAGWTIDRRWSQALAALICAGLALTASPYPSRQARIPIDPPTDARAIGRSYFRPDIQDEWLPRGASLKTGLERYQAIARPAGTCGRVERFTVGVACQVRTTGPAEVTLPHYYFPVGWQASVDGRPVSIRANDRGLIVAELPEAVDGRLELRFTMTPWRRRGWWIAGATAGMLMLLVVAGARRFVR